MLYILVPENAVDVGVAHFKPVAVELSATSICASVPTAKRASTVVKVNRSPLVVSGVTSAVVVQAGTPPETAKT